MAGGNSQPKYPWLIAIALRTAGGLAHLQQIYGTQIRVSRLDGHNLIHLDEPDPYELQLRRDCLNSDLAVRRKGLEEDHLSGRLDIIFLRRRSQDAGDEEDARPRSSLDGAGPGPGC